MLTLRFSKSQLGPIVDVRIEPSADASAQISAAGRTAQVPIAVRMLIDTGAEQTAIDEDKISHWGLFYVSAGFVATMAGSKPVRSYDLQIQLSAPGAASPWLVGPVVVMARPLAFEGRPYAGVIGRDVLDRAVFTYNGPKHYCTIEV